MRFFTLSLYEALDDSESWPMLADVEKAYRTHVERVAPDLGPELLNLADAGLLDDALVARVRYSEVKGELRIVLRCGNLQIGYFDVDLHYEGVVVKASDLQALAEIAKSTKSHRVYENDGYAHELDVVEGNRIVHGMLFNPGIEVNLSCRRLTWERIDRPDRRLPRLKDRFNAQ